MQIPSVRWAKAAAILSTPVGLLDPPGGTDQSDITAPGSSLQSGSVRDIGQKELRNGAAFDDGFTLHLYKVEYKLRGQESQIILIL